MEICEKEIIVETSAGRLLVLWRSHREKRLFTRMTERTIEIFILKSIEKNEQNGAWANALVRE